LDLVLTNKEGLVGNVKVKGSLGRSDHEMVEFKILRTGRWVCSKLATLDFRRADFGLLWDLLCRTLWHKALDKKAGQYSRITSSKLRSNASRPRGSQAEVPGGLHG